MTSKEVIQRLKDDIETGYLATKYDNQKDKENYLIMLNALEKDLEILDLLRKRIHIISETKDSGGTVLAETLGFWLHSVDKDYTKIKEWLEND